MEVSLSLLADDTSSVSLEEALPASAFNLDNDDRRPRNELEWFSLGSFLNRSNATRPSSSSVPGVGARMI